MTYIIRASGEDIVFMHRMKSLLFGVYAWAHNEERHEVKEAGSGIFVAPRLASRLNTSRSHLSASIPSPRL